MKLSATHYIYILFFLLLSIQSDDVKANNQPVDKFIIGINAHILTKDDAEVERMIDSMSSLNFQMVRIDVPWDVIEKQKGKYIIPDKWDFVINKLKSRNIEPLLILDYGNPLYNNGDKPTTEASRLAFANYSQYIAKHFDKVRYFQIWNEWDAASAGTSNGTVNDYKLLVKKTYPMIKEVRPDSIVLTGAFSAAGFDSKFKIGTGNFYEQYITEDMSMYTDGLAVHPYTTYRPHPYNEYWFYLEQLKYLMTMVRKVHGFMNKPVFVTEIGWSTSITRDSISEDFQSEYVSNAICDAKKLGMAGVLLYDIKDDYADRHKTSSGFGLYDYRWKAKIAVHSLSKLKCDE